MISRVSLDPAVMIVEREMKNHPYDRKKAKE